MTALETRLHLLGISDITRANLAQFRPTFDSNINHIIFRFYEFLNGFPEVKELLKHTDVHTHLKPLQKAHWMKLFNCEFDEAFLNTAIKIGVVHYQHKVAPYIYLAGYNFFHTEIIRAAAIEYKGLDLPAVLGSITRIITLDMELALTAYVKAEWSALRGNP